MANEAVTLEVRLPGRDIRSRSELRGRIPHISGRFGQGGQGDLATELEHNQARDIRHRRARRTGIARYQREGPALAGQEGDILFAIHGIGRGTRQDARLHIQVQQLLAGIGGIGPEFTQGGALEDQISCRRHGAAIPRCRMVDGPFRLARLWVESDELALGGGLDRFYEIDVVGQVGGGHCPSGVKAEGLALLFIGRNRRQISTANIECRNIDEARRRIIAHRMPVVRAKRRRVCQIELARLFIAGFGIFDRPTGFQVIAGRPGEAVDKGFGRQHLATHPVDGEEKAVLRRVVEDLHILAVALFGGEDDRLGRRIVPAFRRCFLIMPDIFAGIGFQRDDGRQEQIVPFAIGAHAMVPRVAVADA